MSDVYDVDSFMEMNEVIDDARDQGKRAVVLITAPNWCSPCRAFEPHWNRASDDVDDVVFIRVDYDTNPWVSEDFDNIRSVPHAMLFDTDGIYLREIKVPQGALPFIKDIRS